jgi:hypothetical protein
VSSFEGNFAAYEAAVLASNPKRFAHRRTKYQRLSAKLRRGCPLRVVVSSWQTGSCGLLEGINALRFTP